MIQIKIILCQYVHFSQLFHFYKDQNKLCLGVF